MPGQNDDNRNTPSIAGQQQAAQRNQTPEEVLTGMQSHLNNIPGYMQEHLEGLFEIISEGAQNPENITNSCHKLYELNKKFMHNMLSFPQLPSFYQTLKTAYEQNGLTEAHLAKDLSALAGAAIGVTANVLTRGSLVERGFSDSVDFTFSALAGVVAASKAFRNVFSYMASNIENPEQYSAPGLFQTLGIYGAGAAVCSPYAASDSGIGR